MDNQAFWQRLGQWLRTDVQQYLYHCPVATLMQSAPPPCPDLTVYVCDSTNLEEVQSRIRNFPPLITKRVTQGGLGILAAYGEEWVFRSIAVLGPQTYTYVGYPMGLTAEDAFLEYAETIPSWRGKGVAPGMLGPTARELASRGIGNTYMMIRTDNSPSCKAAEKGGARQVGLITAQRRLGRWSASIEQIVEDHLVVP